MMSTSTMQLVEIDGVSMELFDLGVGEPVMFIHGAGSIECHAILRDPRLAENHRLVHIHRRGYGNSQARTGETSVSLEAADCRAALEYLGINRAHIVGESSGGIITLQYALDFPETVQSITLLEPALPAVINSSPELNAALARAGDRFEAGDKVGAVDAFFQEICGPDYRDVMDPNLPTGWMERLADEMDTIVFTESPAMDAWSFTQEEANRLTMPVLNLVGEDSRHYFHECHDIVRNRIPHAENVVLPGTRHCMLEMNPGGVANALLDFFSRHPIV
jgi:pimeloyl-ACP methyl ester carboxylesterase